MTYHGTCPRPRACSSSKSPLAPANGTLVVYSPGYEEQRAQFSEELSFGRIPFAEPVLCIRSIGGPFEFNIDIISIEDLD